MHTYINQMLKEIETKHDVKIVFACEAGSRAAGLHSPSSDYDIRFIYANRYDSYVTLFEHQDTITVSENKIELHGWDMKKALRLLIKSNPSLLEWFQSPQLPVTNMAIFQKLKEKSLLYFCPATYFYHYRKMAEANEKKVDINDVKSYLTVVKPLLACRWIIHYGTIPPVHFETVVQAVNIEDSLKEQFVKMAQAKRGEIIEQLDFNDIHAFVLQQLNDFGNKDVKKKSIRKEERKLTAFFQQIVKEAWE
ncbi:nucleotidyltransferase domain-containing protein [Alkalihalobacillus sp. LMS39]|uniref:nucleotidyltransferase domain-containing protein n=1 Tax=Alkalihalobacillus sp. LMS39 TaxID=2924032 RepID=UPI001FB2F39A|nr:nucleotidyltransferase domain-containing protein [Alkalihalobacillus sp. LMS39]UOE92554.1 nucleotidyltransferase domain-containing protein [Alkalihalobacillus sp. LMS39]